VTSEHQIRILVADDHSLFREGLVIILNNQPHMKVVAECGDGNDAVALALEHVPDLTILDLQMPGLSGAAATAAILEKLPAAKILLLTTFDGDEDIHRAMHAGARGYLLKGIKKEELIHAVWEVHDGRRYLSPVVGASFWGPSSLQRLTKREKAILRLVAEGKPNKEIGSILNVSEGTVKSHVNAIMEKMNVSSRTEAALNAVRHGLLRD
jgi:two-component system NarL family response regulator